MKLYKLDHEILGHNFYLLPTVQIKTRNPVYMVKNLAIELHFMVFHVRFLFLEEKEQ